MIYEFLAIGFEEVEAIAPVDLLRRAGKEVQTVSVTGGKTVNGAHGIPVVADLLFEEADFSDAELLMLPGGMPGTTNLGAHEGLCALLKEQSAKGGRIAAICAAPTVLGALGILEGKKATCYPGCESGMSGAFPQTDTVVTDGNITTSKGPGTAVAYGLELVRLLYDEKTANELADAFQYI